MRSRKNYLTFNQKKKRITPKLIREIFSWLSITVAAIALAGALVFFFGMQVMVIGDSMEPLLSNGQKVLVDRALSKIISPKTGDIVVLKTAGAGGYGPVEERDKDLIRKELKEGIIDSVWLKENGIII